MIFSMLIAFQRFPRLMASNKSLPSDKSSFIFTLSFKIKISLPNYFSISTNTLVALSARVFKEVIHFTTNNLNKIEGGVVDRSVRIEFNAASSIDWLPRVKGILADYSVTGIADDELLKLIDLCNGSARKILSSTRQIIAKHKLLAA